MSTSRTTAKSESEAVIEWRTERLIEAGVSLPLARTVAADCAYDLHAVLELLARGCPAELAMRILAPLEGRGRPC